MQYLDINLNAGDAVYLSNGDYIFESSAPYLKVPTWFVCYKLSRFTERIPDVSTLEEALTRYEDRTHNVIVR
jgi:hypothetical protein